MTRTTIAALVFGALSVPSRMHAQEHPYLDSFMLTELEGSIRVDWVMKAGSTCAGTEVERSIDGTSFAQVHRIAGICGSSMEPVPYTWLDAAPPEYSTVYYRVKLGINGYSSIKSIVFDQLTESEHRFFPSPVTAQATLVVKLPGGSAVDLRIVDAKGRVVLEQKGGLAPVMTMDLSAQPAGVYSYLAEGEGRVFTGTFVKQ
jgi:hypothetical protein